MTRTAPSRVRPDAKLVALDTATGAVTYQPQLPTSPNRRSPSPQTPCSSRQAGARGVSLGGNPQLRAYSATWDLEHHKGGA